MPNLFRNVRSILKRNNLEVLNETLHGSEPFQAGLLYWSLNGATHFIQNEGITIYHSKTLSDPHTYRRLTAINKFLSRQKGFDFGSQVWLSSADAMSYPELSRGVRQLWLELMTIGAAAHEAWEASGRFGEVPLLKTPDMFSPLSDQKPTYKL